MTSRPYWSKRQGVTPALTVRQVAKQYSSLMASLAEKDYLDEWFGFYCVDADSIPGRAGGNPEALIERRTFREDLWPIGIRHLNWDLDALLTAIEFYYDHVSAGAHGAYHSYNNCGWHWETFDPVPARAEYRAEVNQLLAVLEEGYSLLDSGEVVRIGPSGMETLLEATIPTVAGKDIDPLVSTAVARFRSRLSSTQDRRDAVRDLADILEYIRPELKQVLSKRDDAVLFELANKFAVRHMDGSQLDEYNKPVWLSWMFYFYLATINAVAHLVGRMGSSD